MSKIGHASIGSNSKVNDPNKGDNNGREVCFSTLGKRSWDFVLRTKDKNVAEKMAKTCELGCNNNNIGYSQDRRNSLRTQAKLVGMDLSKITTPCDCDCSSFMSVCAECAGIPIPYTNNNAPTTSSMKSSFMNTGYFDLLTDSKYLTSGDYLKRGDIIVDAGSHTVMILEDGICADISQLEKMQQNQNAIKAIDLSKYNIVTNYKTMAQEIKYAIIRCGYRSSSNGVLTIDDLFNKHIENCISNGIAVGVYFYDQSINEAEAIEQADWVMNIIKPYTVTLPVYIDSEAMRTHNGRADNISKEQRTKNIIAFCNRIQQLGHTTGIYASDSWFKSMLEYDKIKDYHIWCARYSTNKPTIPKYDIWQYGSEQFIWGQKPIDVNWIYNLPSNVQKPQNEANTSQNKVDNNKSNIIINNRVQVSDYLNIRKQPLINATIVGKLYNNNPVYIFGYVHDWYMINTTMDNWVNSKYIKTNMAVTTANLNYREGVGTNCKSLGVYDKGTKVKVLNKTNWTDGEWVLCLDNTDCFGWCSAKYLQMI